MIVLACKTKPLKILFLFLEISFTNNMACSMFLFVNLFILEASKTLPKYEKSKIISPLSNRNLTKIQVEISLFLKVELLNQFTFCALINESDYNSYNSVLEKKTIKVTFEY